MKINIFNSQKSLPIRTLFWRKICKEIAALEGQSFSEFTLHFVDMPEICRIHDEYFNDPTPTDCISFPLDGPGEPYRVLGEVFVCPEMAKEFDPDSPLKETILYVIHGMLHLFGYDDIKNKDKRLMRAAETRHLDHLANRGFI